jgi:oligoxyloglucan reducing-end-specific cellobiohydrolase
MTVDASGTMFAWTPAGNPSQYSTDNGQSWTATTGLPGYFTAVADKVAPKMFYAFGSGSFYSTATSSGTAFTKVNSSPLPASGNCNGSGCGGIVVNFAKAGDVWLPLGSNGLYHSTDAGVTWIKIANVSWANSVAVGAASPGREATQPVFLYGSPAAPAVMGIYRSEGSGANWVRINDDLHQYGGPTLIAADSRVFGRVFLGMNGRGIIYGDIVRRPHDAR